MSRSAQHRETGASSRRKNNMRFPAPIDIFFRSLYCQKKDAIQSVPARHRSYLLNRRYSIDE